jgi:hypothetical protein
MDLLPYLIASFCLSRATVAVAAQRQEALEGQKWLIYPALLLVYIPLATAVLLWPISIAAAFGDHVVWGFILAEFHPSLPGAEGLVVTLCITVALGLWWLFVGILLRLRPRIVTALFRPLGDRSTVRHALWLEIIALAIITISALIGFTALRGFGTLRW